MGRLRPSRSSRFCQPLNNKELFLELSLFWRGNFVASRIPESIWPSHQRYVGNSFEIIPNGTVYSNPIEVFSHTVYLNEKGDCKCHFSQYFHQFANLLSLASAPPPHVTEVIPSFGPSSGNARVVILGSGFLNNPNLVVRFGNIEVKPGFHESGTLTAYAPPCPPGIVAVTVANDRYNFGDTRGYFQYC